MKKSFVLQIAALIMTMLLSSCITPYYPAGYAVYRDVPNNPSFAVFPANSSLIQVDFANKIEAAIIASGLKVYARPAIKEVRTERDIGKVGTNKVSDLDTASAKKVELFAEYEDTEADYIVETYVNMNKYAKVKVIMKESNEVLTIFQMWPDNHQNTVNDKVYEAMKALGMPVKELAGKRTQERLNTTE